MTPELLPPPANAQQATPGLSASPCWAPSFDARRAWILAYIQNNFEASAVNQDFHEKYHAAFPRYARRETLWGAQPVSQAMSDLRRMRKEGSLESSRIGLGGAWQPGFPRWVDGFRIARHLLPNAKGDS